ncbi:MAG: YibE/F family protein [Acidimicrobiales bacterium]
MQPDGPGHSDGHAPAHGHTEGHDHDHTDGDGPAPAHGHSHGHAHAAGGPEARWEDLLASPPLLATAVLLAVAFVATIVGLVSLWPDGQGQDAAIQQAAELGLGTERLDAVVTATSDGPCSYADPADPQTCRNLTFDLEEGPEAGATIALSDLPLGPTSQTPDLAVGEQVVLGYEPSTNFYFYADRDRGSVLLWLVLIFSLVVVALGRRQGLRALLGMALTLAILVGFVARSVLDGHDPLVVAVVAASLIAFVSLFLTHGFNPHAAVALVGTLASLVLTLGLSWVFFRASRFTGLATEEGLTLPLIADIDLVPLLLGGALLGALGALDDVTVTQVATVAELKHRNPDLSVAELVSSGVRVGRDHIASTVNTLLLAYAGASMPLLLLFAVSHQSLASVANSELVAVEIVRTLCGSVGLVAAVPVTTALAALLVAGPARAATASRPATAGDPAYSPTGPEGAGGPASSPAGSEGTDDGGEQRRQGAGIGPDGADRPPIAVEVDVDVDVDVEEDDAVWWARQGQGADEDPDRGW